MRSLEKRLIREKLDTKALIIFQNEWCCLLSSESKLEHDNWKCPYCGKPLKIATQLSRQEFMLGGEVLCGNG